MRKPEYRGNNAWRIGVQDNKQPGRPWIARETIHFPATLSHKEQLERAELAQARLEVAVADGEHVQEKDMTLADFVDEWKAKHLDINVKPETSEGYMNLMKNHVLPHLGSYTLPKLKPTVINNWINILHQTYKRSTAIPPEQRKRKATEAEIEAYKNKKPQLLSQRTIRSCYDCLSYCLSKAVQWEYLRTNPTDKVDRPKIRKRQSTALNDEQAVRLLSLVLQDDRMAFKCAVFLGVLCGLRLGEVGGLMFDDVDWKRSTIRIRRSLHYTPETGTHLGDTKSDSSDRMIYVPEALMRLLEENYYNQQVIAMQIGSRWQGDYRIIANWDGRPYTKDTPSKWFRKFTDQHGFEGVRFHDLRHTHATLLLASNMDPVSVAGRMGHSSPDVTLREYAKFLIERDRKSADIMDELAARAELHDT